MSKFKYITRLRICTLCFDIGHFSRCCDCDTVPFPQPIPEPTPIADLLENLCNAALPLGMMQAV